MATTKISTTTTTTTIESTDGAPLALLPELTVIDGQAFCTSLQIAEHFEKEHFHVMRDIETAITQIAESGETAGEMFQRNEYEIMAGFGKVKKPMYLMNRDGFSLLVMGYTGVKAMKFKLAYIAAFNHMEAVLTAKGVPAVETVSAVQMQQIREQMENVTRYMKHDKARLAQTLYRLLKEEFGYDKIENLPATDFPRVLNWIGGYQDIAHKVYDVTSHIERGFVNAVKRQQKVKPSDVYRDVLKSLETPLGLAIAA